MSSSESSFQNTSARSHNSNNSQQQQSPTDKTTIATSFVVSAATTKIESTPVNTNVVINTSSSSIAITSTSSTQPKTTGGSLNMGGGGRTRKIQLPFEFTSGAGTAALSSPVTTEGNDANSSININKITSSIKEPNDGQDSNLLHSGNSSRDSNREYNRSSEAKSEVQSVGQGRDRRLIQRDHRNSKSDTQGPIQGRVTILQHSGSSNSMASSGVSTSEDRQRRTRDRDREGGEAEGPVQSQNQVQRSGTDRDRLRGEGQGQTGRRGPSGSGGGVGSRSHDSGTDARAQLRQMTSTGAPRLQGIVVTVKEEFGFIKPAHQSEEIYFRLRDVLSAEGDSAHSPIIKERDEVAYFSIKESSRGKMCDRAILLELLPAGTVQLEVCVARSVRAVVLQAPRNVPKEEPGLCRLTSTLTSTEGLDLGPGRSGVEQVELWQRCLPEGLSCRLGDELCLDVQRYRPENLLFARAVKIVCPFPLFRERGRVRAVKTDLGFGFVRSAHRVGDLYFRLSDVLPVANTGNRVGRGTSSDAPAAYTTTAVAPGDCVSFDVDEDIMRSGSGGGEGTTRLKATRLQLITPASDLPQQSDFQLMRSLNMVTLKSNLVGVVLRLNDRSERSDPHRIAGQLQCSGPLPPYPPETIMGLETLKGLPVGMNWELQHSQVPSGLASVCRRACEDVCPEFACESRAVEGVEGLHSIKLWRKKDSDVQSSGGAPGGKPEKTSVRLPFVLADLTIDELLLACPSLPLSGLATTFRLVFDAVEARHQAVGLAIPVVCAPGQADVRLQGICEAVRQLAGGAWVALLRDVFLGRTNNVEGADEDEDYDSSRLHLCVSEAAASLRVGERVSFAPRLWGGRVPLATELQLREAVDDSAAVGASEGGNVVPQQRWLGVTVEGGHVVPVQPLTSERDVDGINRLFWDPSELRSSSDNPAHTSGTNATGSKNSGSSSGAPSLDEALCTLVASFTRPGDDLENRPSLPGLRRYPPLPIRESGAEIAGTAGQLVTFLSVLSESSSLNPVVAATSVMALSPPASPLKLVRGLLTRMDVPLSGSAASSNKALLTFFMASGDGLEQMSPRATSICEVRVLPAESLTASTAVALATAAALPTSCAYYCDIHEIRLTGAIVTDSSEQQGPKLGDVIEFYALDLDSPPCLGISARLSGLAVHPQLIPRTSLPSTVDGITFKPRGALLSGAVTGAVPRAGPLGGSTMAQGPPDDGVFTGFAAGWRTRPAIDGLPWAHLLAHLHSDDGLDRDSAEREAKSAEDTQSSFSLTWPDGCA